MLSALISLALVATADPCLGRDAHGHAFATCFDPWSGLELGGAAQLGSATPAAAFTADLRVRGERASRSKEASTWLTLHRLGATEVRVGSGPASLSVLGYTGLYRRHVREGVLLLPFTPPLQVPFPLDIALLAEALRYERRWAEGSDWAFEPVRLSLLFDPLRAPESQFHLGLGVTTGWRLLQREGQVQHEFTPLTAATLFFSLESDDGRWLARGTVSAGWSFVLPDTSLTLRARGEVELSRVLLAFNDQPLSFFLRGRFAFRDAGARFGSEWSAAAGLSLRLGSAR